MSIVFFLDGRALLRPEEEGSDRAEPSKNFEIGFLHFVFG